MWIAWDLIENSLNLDLTFDLSYRQWMPVCSIKHILFYHLIYFFFLEYINVARDVIGERMSSAD